MNESKPFNALVGKTIIRIDGLSEGNDEIKFVCSDGSEYSMQHHQDCCESVRIEDVCGTEGDIIGFPVLQAEEATSSDNPPGIDPGYQDSFTWTFYRLTTNRGHLYLRIDDETGRELLPFAPADEGVFFSMDVSSGDLVYTTPERCSKIILVQPSEMKTRST